MKQIPLSRGMYAQVDDDVYDEISKHKWSVSESRGIYYASRKITIATKKRVAIKLHRLIMNCPEGMVVDHRDGNGLNCQKSNMRICTNAENCRNRVSVKGKSKYLGVSYHQCKRSKYHAWRAKICYNYKSIFLGYYNTEEEAALAYNLKAIELFGEFANLNIIF